MLCINSTQFTLIVFRGCFVNSTDSSGVTPLHEAVKRKSEDIALALVNAGADINVQAKDGLVFLAFFTAIKPMCSLDNIALDHSRV